MNKTLTFVPVGALYRGYIRRAAFTLDLELTEDKSLFQSRFRVKGDEVKVDQMYRYVVSLREKARALEEEDARIEAEEARLTAEYWANFRWWNPLTWLG